jgi:hypothetical protein
MLVSLLACATSCAIRSSWTCSTLRSRPTLPRPSTIALVRSCRNLCFCKQSSGASARTTLVSPTVSWSNQCQRCLVTLWYVGIWCRVPGWVLGC